MSDRWVEILKAIRDRWPDWEATEVDVKDWERGLAHHNASVVEEALYRTRAKYSSESPRLAWVLRFVDEIHKQQASISEMAVEANVAQNRIDVEVADAARVDQDREEMTEFLVASSPEEVSKALQYLVSKGWVQGQKTNDPRGWSAWAVGMTFSCMSTQPKE